MTSGVIVGVDVSPRRCAIAAFRVYNREHAWIAALIDADHAQVDLPDCQYSHHPIRTLMSRVRVTHGRGRPAAVFVEQPTIPRASGAKAAFDAGRAVQAVYAAFEHIITPELIVPARWKRLAGVGDHKHATYADLEQFPRRPTRAAAKPPVYIRAAELGWQPDGSQDAADAVCIAYAGAREHLTRQEA